MWPKQMIKGSGNDLLIEATLSAYVKARLTAMTDTLVVGGRDEGGDVRRVPVALGRPLPLRRAGVAGRGRGRGEQCRRRPLLHSSRWSQVRTVLVSTRTECRQVRYVHITQPKTQKVRYCCAFTSVFTTRAMLLRYMLWPCVCLCLSVCHKSVFY